MSFQKIYTFIFYLLLLWLWCSISYGQNIDFGKRIGSPGAHFVSKLWSTKGLKVVSHYDLSALPMSVMGLQKEKFG